VKDFFKTMWDFPSHHVALAWWCAAIFTLWNVISRFAVGTYGRISLLGRKFRTDQLAKGIRSLEFLHDNTNGLIRYLANDATDIAIEVAYMLITFGVLFWRVTTTKPGSIVFLIFFNIGAAILGRAFRIKIMLSDLFDYDTSLQRLKARLAKLES
jgi:hypothetical protein